MERGYDILIQLHNSGNNRMDPKTTYMPKNDICQKIKGHTTQKISKVDIKQ